MEFDFMGGKGLHFNFVIAKEEGSGLWYHAIIIKDLTHDDFS